MTLPSVAEAPELSEVEYGNLGLLTRQYLVGMREELNEGET